MSKIVKAGAAVALLLSGATYVMAQAQNPNADSRPFPPDGTNTQPYDKSKEPTNTPEPGVGSRPMGPPAANAPVEAQARNAGRQEHDRPQETRQAGSRRSAATKLCLVGNLRELAGTRKRPGFFAHAAGGERMQGCGRDRFALGGSAYP